MLRKRQLTFYYAATAVRDSWRSRTTLLSNAVILAGICLFILLLIGLKRGLVEQFRNDILKSPTATEIKWWATKSDLALDQTGEASLIQTLPGDSIVVPEITKVVRMESLGGESIESVTLQATVPGDPFLSFHGANIDNLDSRALILSPAAASSLGIDEVKPGQEPIPVKIVIGRQDSDRETIVSLDVLVTAIVDTGNNKTKSGYLSRQLMDRIEDFSQGEHVPEFNWPGRKFVGRFGCQGYLAFTKRAYSHDDINRLHLRGLNAVAVGELEIENAGDWSTLNRLLVPHELKVYFVSSEMQSGDNFVFLDFDVAEVEEITGADDVMLYWSIPLKAKIDNTLHTIIGVSGAMRWLRHYFKTPLVRMDDSDMMRTMLPCQSELKSEIVSLQLDGNQTLELQCVDTPAEIQAFGQVQLVANLDVSIERLSRWYYKLPKPNAAKAGDMLDAWKTSCLRRLIQTIQDLSNETQTPIAIVPTELLSALHKQKNDVLAFDSNASRFVATPQPNRYFNGRIYATVLEDIPVIDDQLQALGYSTLSSRLRVQEMQGYAGTLDLLVNVLQLVAIGLGIVTVSVIFMEVTRRRQTSIGIMQIMGMEPRGVFLFVFVRAVMIAGIGWVLATVCSVFASYILPLTCDADCRFTVGDFVQVLAGALVCSSIGVLFHAWYAANRLDPVDAISGGKVQ